MDQSLRNYLLKKLEKIKKDKISALDKQYPYVKRELYLTSKTLKKGIAEIIIAKAKNAGNYSSVSIDIDKVFDLPVYHAKAKQREAIVQMKKDLIQKEYFRVEDALSYINKFEKEFNV